MATKSKVEPQNPLILRCARLMEAFAKSDDERDFFLDRTEGFILYVDLDKPENELLSLEHELASKSDRYCLIPKLTFYETKKIMEGFVNEKVYDIDTKEKLLDIIQSKEARDNFLEFIYDHHSEQEKWQQYYQERSRIRIIEWLRNNHFNFVFEEDLELSRSLIEKIKRELFEPKASKDILTARKTLISKAKTYYSSEALNPRPKRGRPPKQVVKMEIEPQVTTDIYTTVPASVRPFLFTPDITSSSAVTFSTKFDTEADLLSSRKQSQLPAFDTSLESLNQKLAMLRNLSKGWVEDEKPQPNGKTVREPAKKDVYEELDEEEIDFDEDTSEEDEDEDDFVEVVKPSKKVVKVEKVEKPVKQPAKKEEKKEEKKPVKKVAVAKKPVVAPPAPKKQPPLKKIVKKQKLRPLKSLAKAAPKKPAPKPKAKAVVKPAPKKKVAGKIAPKPKSGSRR